VHAQTQRMRHVGILLGSADNTVSRSRLDAFLQAFRRLGWTEGQNVHLEIRWGANDQSKIAANAKELVGLKPDVILVGPSNTVIALLKETRSTPIVFVDVSDPIGQGVVDSLARPTGNVTGFSALEFSLIGKWLQLLKEAAPGLKRVGLMISTINTTSPRWFFT